MKVSELIAQLKRLPGNATVLLASEGPETRVVDLKVACHARTLGAVVLIDGEK